MSRRAFWRLYGRLEHERMEFKSSAARLGESVVAMAMTEGGTILVGVTDDRRVVGLAGEQEALDRIAAIYGMHPDGSFEDGHEELECSKAVYVAQHDRHP